ncbi:MAG: UpxY family transcription antiterminator [Bacteroidaceae bacterium]|nr:UpxY family transcription antiterminator [Bacteroidaceae bacterium]
MPLFPVGTQIPDYFTKPQWFIGRVKYCHERKAADLLKDMGVEYFLPQQAVRRKWSDRVKTVQVLLLPRYIFIRCKNSDRVGILERVHSITGFMMDHNLKQPATIRENDLETFRRMVDYEDQPVIIDPCKFAPGDHVRVKVGPLMDRECELIEVSSKKCVAVSLGVLGSARIELPLSYIEMIEN